MAPTVGYTRSMRSRTPRDRRREQRVHPRCFTVPRSGLFAHKSDKSRRTALDRALILVAASRAVVLYVAQNIACLISILSRIEYSAVVSCWNPDVVFQCLECPTPNAAMVAGAVEVVECPRRPLFYGAAAGLENTRNPSSGTHAGRTKVSLPLEARRPTALLAEGPASAIP